MACSREIVLLLSNLAEIKYKISAHNADQHLSVLNIGPGEAYISYGLDAIW
jgi:hypothetical protein